MKFLKKHPWVFVLAFCVILFGLSLSAWAVFFYLSRDVATHTLTPEEVQELLAK